jgi:hypothetical protein
VEHAIFAFSRKKQNEPKNPLDNIFWRPRASSKSTIIFTKGAKKVLDNLLQKV